MLLLQVMTIPVHAGGTVWVCPDDPKQVGCVTTLEEALNGTATEIRLLDDDHVVSPQIVRRPGVTIVSDDSDNLATIDAVGIGDLFTVEADGFVLRDVILDLNVNQGRALSVSGGGVTATVEGVEIHDALGDDGGAVYVDGATVEIIDSLVSKSQASGSGGHAAIRGQGTLRLRGTTLEDSPSGYGLPVARGGAVDVGPACTLEVTGGSILEDNTAATEGGHIWLGSGAILTVQDSTLRRGNASDGGAIFASSGTEIVLERVVFDGNEALRGAAIQVLNADRVDVEGSWFCDNAASLNGAALQATNSCATSCLWEDNVFFENDASTRATVWAVASALDLHRNTFIGNTADFSAVVDLSSDGGSTFSHNLIIGNSSTSGGVFTAVPPLAVGFHDNAWYDNLLGNVTGGGLGTGDLDLMDPPVLVPPPMSVPSCGGDAWVDGPANPDLGGIGAQNGDDDDDGVPASVDCDDDEAGTYPGAIEMPADGIDQNCDGFEACYEDLDGDTFGSANLVDSADLNCVGETLADRTGDCDDDDPEVNPYGVEIPDDGTDQDCDGADLTSGATPPTCSIPPPGGPTMEPPPDVAEPLAPSRYFLGGGGCQTSPAPRWIWAGWIAAALLGRSRSRAVSDSPRGTLGR